jgi:hypothetical protein
VIRVNIPGIMKQKSSSDMDVSNGSGGEAFSAPNGVSIVEIGEDSHASAGSGSGSGGSNVNPFTVNTGSMDGPRPMFRPSTHILHDAAATPNGSKSKAGRLSSAGTPNAAEALAMMMHAEYPEGLPEEMQGVSHFANSQRDEPPLADFYGEEDMDLGYDDVAAYDDDGFPEPPAPRKRTTAGVPHKRLRAEMERRKSLALAGLQATEGGVRRSTRPRRSNDARQTRFGRVRPRVVLRNRSACRDFARRRRCAISAAVFPTPRLWIVAACVTA